MLKRKFIEVCRGFAHEGVLLSLIILLTCFIGWRGPMPFSARTNRQKKNSPKCCDKTRTMSRYCWNLPGSIQSGKGNEATRFAEQYLSMHPGSVDGLEMLGVSCAVIKRYDETQSYFNQILKAEPRRSATRLGLASVKFVTGGEQKAPLKTFEQVEVLDYKKGVTLKNRSAIIWGLPTRGPVTRRGQSRRGKNSTRRARERMPRPAENCLRS